MQESMQITELEDKIEILEEENQELRNKIKEYEGLIGAARCELKFVKSRFLDLETTIDGLREV